MHTTTECQKRLIVLGFLAKTWTDSKGVEHPSDDGTFGQRSLDAFNHYRASLGKPPIGPTVTMAQLNADLFQEDQPTIPKGFNMPNIFDGPIATAKDYLLNFAQSKIVWVSGATVALADAWINTSFGFVVPDSINKLVASGIVTLGGLVIAWLRTFKSNPSVINGIAVNK